YAKQFSRFFERGINYFTQQKIYEIHEMSNRNRAGINKLINQIKNKGNLNLILPLFLLKQKKDLAYNPVQ
ncbi:MAG TPA: hypothetical protein DCQ58_10410, partial [Saprospirales bacterium]|nr:hypothetical protein [Saprospirales bacterium]